MAQTITFNVDERVDELLSLREIRPTFVASSLVANLRAAGVNPASFPPPGEWWAETDASAAVAAVRSALAALPVAALTASAALDVLSFHGVGGVLPGEAMRCRVAFSTPGPYPRPLRLPWVDEDLSAQPAAVLLDATFPAERGVGELRLATLYRGEPLQPAAQPFGATITHVTDANAYSYAAFRAAGCKPPVPPETTVVWLVRNVASRPRSNTSFSRLARTLLTSAPTLLPHRPRT